jgi:hypothetical protein
MNVKFPNITVSLIHPDGYTGTLLHPDSNPFVIMGVVKKALRTNNVPEETIDAFFEEAANTNLNGHSGLLQVVTKWVNVA